LDEESGSLDSKGSAPQRQLAPEISPRRPRTHQRRHDGDAETTNDPSPGDIGYWAPDGDLVFYYGDVGLWNGIVRSGEFDAEMDAIERQSDDFNVRIERVE
jgi:hypothetical protein